MIFMYRNLRLLLFYIIFLPGFVVYAQETGYGPGYQLAMIGNPGITGSEGDGYIRLSYMNLFPGNSYNLHSAFFSYDGYFPSLHGGAGLYISDNYLGGIVNDLKGGLSYAYFFQAGRDLYFSSGLSASCYHRGYSFADAVLPDQIDPLGGSVLPSGEVITEEGRTIFDLGTGLVFYTGRISGGLAVNHLAEPDLSVNDIEEGKLKRRLFLHMTADFDLGSGKKLRIQPLGFIEMQKNYSSATAGAVLVINYLSVSSLINADNGKNLDLQTGFSVDAGIINIFYSYRFNLLSGQNLLPFSLLHHAGMGLRLNNVDKRKTIKTINFPKL
jgi:type IX secretion system PorP/SprF family membrane protein